MALKYLWSYARQVVKLNGLPMVGGHFEVFIHNTTTKYITKADFDGTDNPFKVYLDSRGMALMLADDSQKYDIYCYDEFNGLYWSRSEVSAGEEYSDVTYSLWIHCDEVEEDSEAVYLHLDRTDVYGGAGWLDDDLEKMFLFPIFRDNVIFNDVTETITFNSFVS